MTKYIFCVLFLSSIALSDELRVEVLTGTAFNPPMPLHIHQGNDDINLAAQYSTRPFVPAPYYDLKAGLWSDGKGWELELLHDKIYLDNTTSQVQDFRSTFGYNMVFVNRGWELNRWLVLRIGAGPLITHPMNTVNGLSEGYDEPTTQYVLSGVATQVSLSGRLKLVDGVYLLGETKLTGAYGEVPVNGGYAQVPDTALHILGGIGLSF